MVRDADRDPAMTCPDGSSGTDAVPRGDAVVAETLRARSGRIAHRWAETALFQAAYRDRREAAVEAAHRLVDALAEVAETGRCTDPRAAGFTRARPYLAEIAAARAMVGATASQVGLEVAELCEPLAALVRDHADARAAVAELMGTLRLVAMEAGAC